ncbi:hypothetical protein D3C57_144225 [Streptomyces rapamycinicus NRRL 5491]|uniref:Glycoside hydrolase family 65 central catalytic domain-containing protein n=1 Tax=Streptomyces rapamycinicus (strain ATCC 29253 / DSM 41530 / NRRL 5491 / AYB-994) TaxID=1343740 RepID=A0A3L8QWJ2_STRRN|nr:hypothetical protein D3C57_144225 [Streptomyces rapamycinicus NRRL 5491]
MYPSVLAQHPDIAKSMLQYRINRTDAARKYAKDGGYSGTRFPWESALSGLEDTPSWASTGRYEQHISSDISLAVWQYWLATGDRTWLRDKGAEILRGVADFWVSRVTRNADGSSSINGVTPPDEYVENIDDSAYTNMAARDSLRFTVQAAKIFGRPANPQWSRVADSLRIPFDAKTGTHPEYDGYARLPPGVPLRLFGNALAGRSRAPRPNPTAAADRHIAARTLLAGKEVHHGDRPAPDHCATTQRCCHAG